MLSHFLVDDRVDCGSDETQCVNTSRWPGKPNHHWLETSHWISSNLDSVHFSSRLWTLISKWTAKVRFIWKQQCTQCRWHASDVVLGSGVAWQQECNTCSPFPWHVCVWWLLIHWLQPLSLLVKLHKVLELDLLDNPHKAAVIPVACAPLPTTLFPSSRLSMNVFWYRTLQTACLMNLEESKVLPFEFNYRKNKVLHDSLFFFEMHLYMTKNRAKKQNDSELKDITPQNKCIR